MNILIENLFADGPNRDAVPCWSTYAVELNQLMDAFPGLYICLDSGHAAITGQEPAELVYQLGDRIKALHLHGNDRIQDLHLTPFETADMGWEPFCRALRDIRYQGTINLEVLSAVRRTPMSVRPALYAYLHACADYFVQLTESAE
jgi:sugar phosphate isomerase/epimerase